jgi:pseudaminic acid biosynthesis-associated methylase
VTSATEQLAAWHGEFGNSYTDRNVIDWWVRMPAFKRMLEGLEIHRVLEVGCNRGHNLRALSVIVSDESEIFAVEPNSYALGIARTAGGRIYAVCRNAFDLPFKDSYFDLVLTVGVLIHLSTNELSKAMQEVARVSRRYIFAAEYYAAVDTAVDYRGHSDLLWKRDF